MRSTFFTLAICLGALAGNAQTWTQKANFTGPGRYSTAGFVIGNKGYIGTGNTATTNSFTDDFWQYDPATDSWTQKATYPGGPMYGGVGFSIGSKGYIGLGYVSNTTNSALMYEYDPNTNMWTQKTSMPVGRTMSSAFVAGTKAYIVGGIKTGISTDVTNEVWAFDPAANSWTQRSSLPGQRARGVAFAINGVGYYGTGNDATTTNHDDFWQYDTLLNAWIAKANFPDARRTASGFVIGNSGYIGGGYATAYVNSFFEYNPITDTWTQRQSYPVLPECWAQIAFAIGNKGYMGLGRDASNNILTAWCEYTPSSQGVEEAEASMQISVQPNPVTDILKIELDKANDVTVEVYSTTGQLVKREMLKGSDHYELNVSSLAKGMYYVKIGKSVSKIEKL